MEENVYTRTKYDCDKRSQNLCFLILILKREIEFIRKSDESLAETKTKNEIQQLVWEYKHVNNIH